ncbi:MAG TPA: ion channel [Kofleriaceae bacterium]|nr:ion channel [Kofleriaceae bacterium]
MAADDRPPPTPHRSAAPPPPLLPMFQRNGSVTIERRGLPRTLGATVAQDLYHLARRTTWTRLFGGTALLFLAINLLFAAILYAGHATITHARADSFWDRFYFSVQTMATIGYGLEAPSGTFANTMVVVEAFVGIVFTAVATGLVFAKFGTTTAKVLWSNVAVVSRESGVPTLQFRMANGRTAAIVEAHVNVYLSWTEVLASGERTRRIYDLALRRSTSPLFALSWTAYHPIEGDSPLCGVSPEELAERDASIIVTFTGIDDALATTVHARTTYPWTSVVWNRRFVDIIKSDPIKQVRYLDYPNFHVTEPDDAPRS